MKHEEMEDQIRQAIVAYYEETKRYVERIDTCFLEHHTIAGRGPHTTLRRLTITTTDEAPSGP